MGRRVMDDRQMAALIADTKRGIRLGAAKLMAESKVLKGRRRKLRAAIRKALKKMELGKKGES